MKDISGFLEKIKNKSAKIGVIGLGYVGLPLAVLFAEKGFKVTGFVRNKKKVDLLNNGNSHLCDSKIDNTLKTIIKNKSLSAKVTNPIDLQKQDIIIVCVPTPVDKGKKPDLTDLITVSKELSKLDLSGKLIINESTVAPFTTREIFGKITKDCFLACSPERVDPGNRTKTTKNIPKVVGGINKESAMLAKELYGQILHKKIIEVKSLEAAEMTKMLENTYRAINIALINEFAKLSEKCQIDILDVINAAKSKWSFQPHYPSIGVGGHCIPVDPYYILEFAKKKGVPMKVVEYGLLENEEMPKFVAEKVKKIYRSSMKVLVYGLTYKKDVNDIRESPAVALCNLLKNQRINFRVYDPLLNNKKIEELGFKPGTLGMVDLFIVGTDHSTLSGDYPKVIGKKTIIVDGRNFFSSRKGEAIYGIGRVL